MKSGDYVVICFGLSHSYVTIMSLDAYTLALNSTILY